MRYAKMYTIFTITHFRPWWRLLPFVKKTPEVRGALMGLKGVLINKGTRPGGFLQKAVSATWVEIEL